jgi:hypothetical protein
MEVQVYLQSPMMPSQDQSQPTQIMRHWFTKSITAVEGDIRTERTVIDSVTLDMPGMAAMLPAQARDMMSQQMGMMRGLTTTTRIDSRGRRLGSEVQGPNLPPQVREQMAQLGQGIGQGGGPMFPDRPIRVGESWTDSQTVSMGGGTGGGMGRGMGRGMGAGAGSAGWIITFRLERVERQGGSRIAVISMNGSMSAGGQLAGGEGLSASGSLSGEFRIDLGASRMVGMRMNMDASMGMQGQMRSQSVMELIGT